MRILRTSDELSEYLNANDCKAGCFADTGFLYGAAFKDDRLFGKASDAVELIAEREIPLYANVISRMEFIDLILRKQLTAGCVELLGRLEQNDENEKLFNLLKNIRDNQTAAKRNKESYKISENHLKKLRGIIKQFGSEYDWNRFCAEYADRLLFNEWKMLEEDLGLNFVEVLDGGTSEFFKEPLRWNDMVQIMGKHGMRGPDAMIANLFLKSRFQLLITGDSDFETVLEDSPDANDKAVFIL